MLRETKELHGSITGHAMVLAIQAGRPNNGFSLAGGRSGTFSFNEVGREEDIVGV